jgi:hypothetical protein
MENLTTRQRWQMKYAEALIARYALPLTVDVNNFGGVNLRDAADFVGMTWGDLTEVDIETAQGKRTLDAGTIAESVLVIVTYYIDEIDAPKALSGLTLA